MNDPNPYRAPDAAIVDLGPGADLADLGERLGAALIDGVIMMCVMAPAMWFGGYITAVFEAAMSGGKPPFTLILTWSAIGFLILVLIQGYPLQTSGQTWGKRVLGIRIVNIDGRPTSLGQLLAKRYLPINVAALIPLVGNILILVDILLIFRQDRRCAHDLIAGTRVIKAR